MVRGGRSGEDEATALESGLAIVGFSEVANLSGVQSEPQILELVKRAFAQAGAATAANWSRQLAAFALRMQAGDIVVMPLKSKKAQVAIGIVSGPYGFRRVGDSERHVRPVVWVRPDAPRTAFKQDLLFSLGAFLTVCRVQRNEAERRVAAVLAGRPDPGPSASSDDPSDDSSLEADFDDARSFDVTQASHDEIVARIQTSFRGHALARLVEAVLCAEGYQTELSPPGPDRGVDILAGRGGLGLDGPSLCVQVKSSISPADVNVFRALLGSMKTFGASTGLLVSWGGFTAPTEAEARQSHFQVRLWDAADLVQAIYRTYDRLPEDVQAELPLKRIWTLVHEPEE